MDPNFGLLSRYHDMSSRLAAASDTQRYTDTSRLHGELARHVLPSTPTTLPYPLSNTHNNMAILEQSRALTTLPLSGGPSTSTPYPLVSPHSVLGSIAPQSTLAPSSYLASSPVLSSSFLYPTIYNNPGPSQYQPNVYIHTNEGRTLELLGAQQQQQPALTPPPPQLSAITRDRNHEDTKPKQAVPMDSVRDPSAGHHEPGDPVWRPY